MGTEAPNSLIAHLKPFGRPSLDLFGCALGGRQSICRERHRLNRAQMAREGMQFLARCYMACSLSWAPLASFARWWGRNTAGPFPLADLRE